MGYIHVKKANCKNCYKCLKNCVVKSIRYIDGQVDVISDGCILCGKCVNVCPQGAKTVVNPLEGILSMLRDPAVKTARPKERLVQRLRTVGRCQNDNTLAAIKAVHLGQQLV